jgi:Protein of unknown function (DUF1194)
MNSVPWKFFSSLIVFGAPWTRCTVGMRRSVRLLPHVFLLGLLLFASAAGAAGPPVAVDAAVVLAADVSRSIDDGEFALQRRGYADAIENPKLIDAISTGPHQAIALAYVEWAGEGEQKQVVNWTIIRNASDAHAFTAALTAAPRSFVGRTAIGSAIDFSFTLLGASDFTTDRRIIDVSGDGTSNQGRPVTAARDAAVEAGAVINGLTIYNRRAAALGGYLAMHTNPPGGLAQYYRDNVIGGKGAFVVPIDDFNSFADAMTRKLVNEIAEVNPGRSGTQTAAATSGLLQSRPLQEAGAVRRMDP